ncbi:MAG TPA: alkaline phosphatase family protein [Solirubrobacterales bacterium]|nr:alkaline phosphatase family protein [Solirubrobacterales bacterium]
MKKAQSSLQKAIAAAGEFTGQRFALLVASSLLATSAIVLSAVSGSNGVSPLAEAAAQAYLEEEPAAVAAAPAPVPAPEATPASPTSSPESVPSGEAASSGPLPAPAPIASEAPPPPSEPEAPTRPPSEPELPEAGPVKHVFLVSLASPGYDAAFEPTASQMPYLSGELRDQGVLLSNFALLDTAASPNLLAAIGGLRPTAASKADCGDYEACLQPVETLSLADQLSTGQLTWHAYLEDMADAEGKPDNCVHPEPDAVEAPATGGYAAKLNPFVYFHSLLDLGDCAANDVPLSELSGDLKKADATANFNYIAPNLCNSGFRGQCPEGTADGAAAANAWLEKVVPEILKSPAYKKDGLLIVSFGAADPAPPTDPAAAPADPLRTGALLVSPLLTPGGTDATHYDPYSLLRSSEDLFGLAPLGAAEGKKVRSFASAFVATETAAGD